ncbi:MAG: ABC transporter ATP-binding protein, partial [Gammaproteobacteria bacterium]
LKDMSQKDRVLQWRFLRFGLIMSGMAFLIQVFSIGLLLSFGAKGLLSPGDFAFIFIVANNLMYQVWFFTETLVKFSEQYGSFKHALEFLTQTPTEPKNQNIPLSIQNIIPNIQVSKGEIVFQEVNFAFSSQEKIFNQKSLIIPGGQKVGIVGYSGSGKSTFVNLITRLLDINHQQGKILIDNQTIHEASLKSLRENIAFIPQDQVLFHRSILENIRYSKLEAPEEEIIHAAQKAHAHDFIMKLPQQYHTLVGERGIKLSGGQKQRIAIARAILKDSPILILDEATSALDSITESLIQKSLNSLMQNKTVIVIAHRLSTIMNLDRILVFHNGMIVEDGTHQELLENNRLYTHLWTMQEK